MSRIIQALIALLVFLGVGILIFVPTIIVTTRPYSNWQFEAVDCGDQQTDDRIDCFPDMNRPTRRQCQMRGCCWREVTWDRFNKVPECYFPIGVGYRVIGDEHQLAEGFELDLFRRHTPRLFYEEIENLRFKAEYYKENILHLKMYEYRYVDRTDRKFQEWEDRRWKPRFEVPLEYPKTTMKNTWGEYELEYDRNPFVIRVRRKRSNNYIMDTGVGALVFEDQFIQLTSRLPNSMMYGLGEHVHRRYRHEVYWHTWGIFAADNEPDDVNKNLNGHLPFFMGLDDFGNAYGILLVNSNAQDVMLTPGSFASVTWRTIGGILDFWIFTGPTPEEVIAQYTEIVGRPHMPPFWALGLQLGRADWADTASIQEVVDRNVARDIPFDVIYSDVTYMKDYMTFTYDDQNFAGLPNFVRDLNAGGKKYVITLNSGVSNQVPEPKNFYHFYYYGEKYGYYINETDKKTPARGYQWPGEVTFADFTDPRTKDWWGAFAYEFYTNYLPFDGVVMDMNEPGNMVNGSKAGCGNRKWNYPPWVPNLYSRMLYYKTVCMDYEQHLGLHYNVHSLNGHFAAEAGQFLMEQVHPDKRSLVLARSTFPGTGRYAGHHLGKNRAGWDEMYQSLISVLEFNLFGIPYVGPNACGYYDNADMELCIRWTQMAAFFPMFRIYKARDTNPADPAFLGDEFITNTQKAIQTRYQLLPYMYTLFYRARLDGFTVIRPVLNEFPANEETWDVDWEFMLGPALLVAPVLDPGASSVTVYMPDDRFYEFYEGLRIQPGLKNSNMSSISAPIDGVVAYVRGGYIIPMQEGVSNSSEYSRMEPITLLVAIPEELQGVAKGDLFWDDGSTYDSYERQEDLYLEFFGDREEIFILSQRTGMIEKHPELIDTLPVINRIKMYGIITDPGNPVAVDRTNIDPSQYEYNDNLETFTITGLNLDIISDHTIQIGSAADPN